MFCVQQKFDDGWHETGEFASQREALDSLPGHSQLIHKGTTIEVEFADGEFYRIKRKRKIACRLSPTSRPASPSRAR